jgi:hypothetical protein
MQELHTLGKIASSMMWWSVDHLSLQSAIAVLLYAQILVHLGRKKRPFVCDNCIVLHHVACVALPFSWKMYFSDSHVPFTLAVYVVAIDAVVGAPHLPHSI